MVHLQCDLSCSYSSSFDPRLRAERRQGGADSQSGLYPSHSSYLCLLSCISIRYLRTHRIPTSTHIRSLGSLEIPHPSHTPIDVCYILGQKFGIAREPLISISSRVAERDVSFEVHLVLLLSEDWYLPGEQQMLRMLYGHQRFSASTCELNPSWANGLQNSKGHCSPMRLSCD